MWQVRFLEDPFWVYIPNVHHAKKSVGFKLTCRASYCIESFYIQNAVFRIPSSFFSLQEHVISGSFQMFAPLQIYSFYILSNENHQNSLLIQCINLTQTQFTEPMEN